MTLTTPRRPDHFLAVLATGAGTCVFAFAAWWNAMVAPSVDDSDTGRYVGTGITKVGCIAALLLLGGLLARLSGGPGLVAAACRLELASLALSAAAFALVGIYLALAPEQAALLLGRHRPAG